VPLRHGEVIEVEYVENRVLLFGSIAGFLSLDPSHARIFIEHRPLAGAHGNVTVNLATLMLWRLVDALVARVAADTLLITVESHR
jgi:hypothetical protein